MKQYVFISLFISLITISFIAIINYIVDPIDIFGSTKYKYFNAVKPSLETHIRTWKAYKLNEHPDTILLGTSRIMQGIDPTNANFASHHVFNCGIAGGLPFEFEYFFDKALKNGKLKTVIIGLDEHAFYYRNLSTPDFKISDFDTNIFSKYTYLFSVDIFQESIQTILKQHSRMPFLSNGLQNDLIAQDYVNNFGHHNKFLLSEAGYRTHDYSSKIRDEHQLEHFKAFSRLLIKAHKNNVQTILFISPSHARQWEVLDSTIGFDKLEKWKRNIVEINEKTAKNMGKRPFVIWDFSSYNELTTEPVPPLNDHTTQMEWWWDSNHYKIKLGNIILDRMFNTNFHNGMDYPDFGVKLTSENIEQHLSLLRKQRQAWQRLHPEDIKAIQSLKH